MLVSVIITFLLENFKLFASKNFRILQLIFAFKFTDILT